MEKAIVLKPVSRALLAIATLLSLAPAETLSFNTVSIKRGDRGARIYNFEPNRFTASHASLATLISIAYDLPIMGSTRIEGGPSWVRVEHFDVTGNIDLPAGTQPAERARNMKLMLRAMLADRLKLVLRTETRDLRIYALTVAKGGPQLKPAALDEKDCAVAPLAVCHNVNGGPNVGMQGKAVDMEDIARAASTFSDRPVVDKTGLQGLFEIHTSPWADTRFVHNRGWDSSMSYPQGPSIYAIFERLGLVMQGAHGPVQVFVIEHAERPVTD
jgi:uncharacterized protein (TIGR03435 family)